MLPKLGPKVDCSGSECTRDATMVVGNGTGETRRYWPVCDQCVQHDLVPAGIAADDPDRFVMPLEQYRTWRQEMNVPEWQEMGPFWFAYEDKGEPTCEYCGETPAEFSNVLEVFLCANCREEQGVDEHEAVVSAQPAADRITST
jgi:protein-arginine kinase activator protein McsA